MRWARRLLGAAAAALLVVGVTAVPFVSPRTGGALTHVDAVIVLSGDHGERLPRALDLIERGVTSTLVFDGTVDRAEEEQWCREGWKGAAVICLRPDPDSTRAEARAAAELARERKWKHVAVVTTSYHVPRAGRLFERCLDSEVSMISGPPPLRGRQLLRTIAREWMATAYVTFLERDC